MTKKSVAFILTLLGIVFTGNAYAIETETFGAVEIHGFISQGYLISDENNFYADTENGGTSQFNEVGLNFKSNVSDRLRVGVQFFTRDLGRMGNNEITVDYAFADYSFANWLNFKAGMVKIPYGLYNMERDVDMLRTFIFLPQSFYNEAWRDTANSLNGGGFYGYIPVGGLGSFSYNIYGGNTSIDSEAGVIRLLESKVSASMELEVTRADVDYTTAATVTWETMFGIDGLRVVAGVSEVVFDAHVEHNHLAGYKIPWVDKNGLPLGPDYYDNVRTNGVMHVSNLISSFSAEYVWDNMVFAAEVAQNDLEFKYDQFANGGVTAYKTLGWYASMTYRFTDWFELGVNYGEYYADKNDRNGNKSVQSDIDDGIAAGLPTDKLRPADNQYKQFQKDLTIAARFDLSANWAFKLEGHSINGGALLLQDENKSDANGYADYEPKWYLGAAKLSYSF